MTIILYISNHSHMKDWQEWIDVRNATRQSANEFLARQVRCQPRPKAQCFYCWCWQALHYRVYHLHSADPFIVVSVIAWFMMCECRESSANCQHFIVPFHWSKTWLCGTFLRENRSPKRLHGTFVRQVLASSSFSILNIVGLNPPNVPLHQ